MKKRISKFLTRTLPLLLGVFLVYYAYSSFSNEQLEVVSGYFRNARYEYVVLASVFSIIGLWSRAYRWNYALSYMGYKSETSTNIMALSIGYLMNLTLPRSGEFSRALVLQKYQKVPFDKGFGTIVSERVVDLFCLMFCVLLAVLYQYQVLKVFLLEKIPFKYLIVLGIVFVLAFFTVMMIFKYVQWKIVLFLKQKISGLVEGVSSIFKMPYRKVFLFHTFLIWASYVATFYVGSCVIPETSSLSFGGILAAFVAGSFAISFTNGGFGAFPLIVAELLLIYKIPLEAGTAFGWILWGTQTGLVVVMGGLSFMLLPILKRQKK